MANGDKKETKEASEENGKKAEKASKESQEKSRFQEILAYIEKTDLEYVYFEKSDVKISMRRSGVAPSEQKYAISQTDSQKEEIAADTKLTDIATQLYGQAKRAGDGEMDEEEAGPSKKTAHPVTGSRRAARGGKA